ncbi:MAG TPA: signal peptidase I [Solirubrobacteraceae bacterium]
MSRSVPIPVAAAMVASVVALAVLWVSPAAGLVLAGVVIIGGLVLLATGRPAAGVVVALMPFVVFLLASQVVGSLWFKPYRVPSGSMEPTIEIGDRVLADRHHPTPHVGDVVIAHPPIGAVESRCGIPQPEGAKAPCARPTPELSDIVFIKRVVAGPGDTIAFRDGLVVRNGRPVSEPYARSCTDAICEMPQAITVPKGAWFLAGDFRGESDDSRFWGPVPTRAITGVVRYRYWPLKDAGRL